MLLVELLNDSLGQCILDDIDPKGLDELENELKRGDDNDGMVYEISVNLEYSKKGRRFIQQVYESGGGIEGVVTANVYEVNPNTRTPEAYYQGRVKMPNYDISETKLKTSMEQVGLQIKVVNLIETDVDLETQFSQGKAAIPATPTINTTLHAKKILKSGLSEPVSDVETAQLDVLVFNISGDITGEDVEREGIAYGQIDTSKQDSTELEETFQTPYAWSKFEAGMGQGAKTVAQYKTFLQANKNPRFEIYRAKEGGVLDIKGRMTLKHQVFARNDGGDIDICGTGALGRVEILGWVEHRSNDDTILLLENIGEWNMSGCGGNERIGNFETKSYEFNDVALDVGSKIYVYFTVRVWGSYDPPSGADGSVAHEFRVQPDTSVGVDGLPMTYNSLANETSFRPTTAKAIMIHEALKKMCQYYTDQDDCFYSPFFGRVDSVPAYPEDGPGSLMALTNGSNVRGRVKTIFANLKDAITALNTIWCISWGFETINGVQKIRIDKKEHFFNKDELTLDLGQVDGVRKIVDMRYYYSQVEIGYPKIDAGQINGIDELNTVRRFKSPLTQAKTKFSIRSPWRASGYEIEALRRLQSETKDSKLDDDNFLICMRRDGINFVPEKNEDFLEVTNIFDPSSSYNLRITPAQNFIRHAKIWAAMVLKQANKLFEFTYGELNYIAGTRRSDQGAVVNENGNVDVTGVEPLWYPERYEFVAPLRSDEFKIIRQKPYGFIRFRDNLNVIHEGYILSITHKPEAKKGTFKLLRVFRNV
jgi:hypothetical protein